MFHYSSIEYEISIHLGLLENTFRVPVVGFFIRIALKNIYKLKIIIVLKNENCFN